MAATAPSPVTRKDPTAQVGGAMARRSGRAFETALDHVNAWYDRQGVALVEKVNPPVAGWGDSLHVGHSTVDYTGTVHHAGRRCGVAFDAKSVAGVAAFGPPSATAGKGRDRRRFFAQVDYLRNARDRHGYVAGFLLYCADLDTAWWCGPAHLDALARGDAVPMRTKHRGTKKLPGRIEHHLPACHAPLERAAVAQVSTRRPLLDYLALLFPPAPPTP